MAQRSLRHQIPNVQGSKKYGFDYLSFIKSDTVFATSGGLSGIAVEGQLRYDSSEHNFKYWNGSADTAVAVSSSSSTGLDAAYDMGRTITVDGGAVTLAANGSIGMTITQATNYNSLYINNTAGSGNAIDIQNAGTGYDIEGSDNSWHITKAGVAVFTGASGMGNMTGNDLTLTTSTVSITGDATTGTVATINLDTLTSGVGLLLDMNAASTATLFDILVGAAHVLTVTDTGVLTLAGVAEGTSTLTLTTGDLTLTDGDITITSGQFTMTGDANADVMTVTGATTGNNDVLYVNGTTSAGSGSILKIDQGAGARTGHAIDVNMGTTATGMSALDISCTGGTRTVPVINIDSDGTASDFIKCVNSVIFTGNMLNLVQDTSAATGNFIFINNDSGTSMEAINIDDEANVEDIVLITATGNTGAGNALINLVANGTPNATANALLVNYSGITATNNPYAAKIDASGVDAGALTIDSDAATVSAVVINGGGALANNKALLELTWDGTPANAGTNMLRVDGSGGTNTAKPVLVEIYDDNVSVGLSVSTATIEDMVTFIGTGATGSAKSVVDITSTAVMNAAGNLLRLDLTGADTTSVPTALEIVGAGETARGIYVDTDGTTVGAAKFHSGGALTNGVGVVNITNDGNLAAGGNLLNLTMGGTPADATVCALEIVAAKDCYALDITTSAATSSAMRITGIGAIANDKAMIEIAHSTGTAANGASLIKLTGATAASATAYGLTIDCSGANFEAIWVEAGKVKFAETLEVTGVTTCTGGVVSSIGTTANLHDTAPVIGDLTTAFGAAYATKTGWLGTVIDSSTSKVYLCSSNGTTFTYTLMSTSQA